MTDRELVDKLKVMTRHQIGCMTVEELEPLAAIWALVERVNELENPSVAPLEDIPGLKQEDRTL